MAQQVKAPAAFPGNLSSIPRTHTVEGEHQTYSCRLFFTSTKHMHTPLKKISKILKIHIVIYN